MLWLGPAVDVACRLVCVAHSSELMTSLMPLALTFRFHSVPFFLRFQLQQFSTSLPKVFRRWIEGILVSMELTMHATGQWRPSLIVVDVETSGLDDEADQILSIGAVDFDLASTYYEECRLLP